MQRPPLNLPVFGGGLPHKEDGVAAAKRLHNRMEKARRDRVNRRMMTLDALCVRLKPSLMKKRRDRDAILVNTINIIHELVSELQKCTCNRGGANNGTTAESALNLNAAAEAKDSKIDPSDSDPETAPTPAASAPPAAAASHPQQSGSAGFSQYGSLHLDINPGPFLRYSDSPAPCSPLPMADYDSSDSLSECSADSVPHSPVPTTTPNPSSQLQQSQMSSRARVGLTTLMPAATSSFSTSTRLDFSAPSSSDSADVKPPIPTVINTGADQQNAFGVQSSSNNPLSLNTQLNNALLSIQQQQQQQQQRPLAASSSFPPQMSPTSLLGLPQSLGSLGASAPSGPPGVHQCIAHQISVCTLDIATSITSANEAALRFLADPTPDDQPSLASLQCLLGYAHSEDLVQLYQMMVAMVSQLQPFSTLQLRLRYGPSKEFVPVVMTLARVADRAGVVQGYECVFTPRVGVLQ